MGRVLGKNRRLTISDLLRILGFENKERQALSPSEWIRAFMGKPLAAPTPRPKQTRGWHQKRNRRRGPNYAKLLRRQARAAAKAAA